MSVNSFERYKPTIGRLISYYQETAHIANDDLIANAGVDISYKTLINIKNGTTVKNDDYYTELAKALDKKVCIIPSVYDDFDRLRTEIADVLIDLDFIKLKKLSNTIAGYRDHYHDYLYLDEMLKTYRGIVDFYLEYYFPDDDIELLVKIKDKLEEKDAKMVLFLIRNREVRYKNIYKDKLKYRKETEKYLDDPMFFAIKIQDMVHDPKAHFDVYDVLNQMISTNTLVPYQRYVVYNYLAYIESENNSYDRAYQHIEECMKILDEINATDGLKSDLTRQAICVLYMAKRYSEVISYKSVMDKLKNKSYGSAVLLMIDSYQKLDMIDELKQFIKDQDSDQNVSPIGKKIIKYFKLKYAKEELTKYDLTYLEDIICEELFSTPAIGNTIWHEIYMDELNRLVKMTRNYKKLSQYKERYDNLDWRKAR